MANPALLRDVRTAQGKTLREVAEAASIDPTALSRIERGLRDPGSHVLRRIYGALGLTRFEEALLTREPSEAKL